jgi:hypothetical protein
MAMSEFSIDAMCRAAKESITHQADLDVARHIAQMACEAEPDDAKFKYQARVLWWDYCAKTQSSITFRKFWNNEKSYPRTIK